MSTTHPPLVLAGDIGGTYCRFGIFGQDALPGGQPLATHVYDSKAFQDALDPLKLFLQETGLQISAWCIAVAGPTDGQSGAITNLKWPSLDADAVRALVGAPGFFINDFAAVARAIPYIPAEDLVALHDVPPDPLGTRVVTGPGSGLGVAILLPTSESFSVMASEGGHMGFAPRTDLQVNLLNWLRRGARARNESVLSGRGLYGVFQFFEERVYTVAPAYESTAIEIKRFLEENPKQDPAPIISQLAISGRDPACRAALDLFCEILGAAAGDYALMAVATGGVYLVGGVIRGIIDYLQGSKLLEHFLDKRPLEELISRVPLYAVKTDPGLLGAALEASRM